MYTALLALSLQHGTSRPFLTSCQWFYLNPVSSITVIFAHCNWPYHQVHSLHIHLTCTCPHCNVYIPKHVWLVTLQYEYPNSTQHLCFNVFEQPYRKAVLSVNACWYGACICQYTTLISIDCINQNYHAFHSYYCTNNHCTD